MLLEYFCQFSFTDFQYVFVQLASNPSQVSQPTSNKIEFFNRRICFWCLLHSLTQEHHLLCICDYSFMLPANAGTTKKRLEPMINRYIYGLCECVAPAPAQILRKRKQQTGHGVAHTYARTPTATMKRKMKDSGTKMEEEADAEPKHR